MQNSLSLFCEKILDLKKNQIPFVVVTLTSARGSTPQDMGARMIVGDTPDPILFGTVGGGKIENHCIEYAQKMIGSEQKKVNEKWNLQKDIGMTCGGEVQFLFENEGPSSDWNIVIFGAGHISQKLTQLLLNLNCQLTVIDNRQEWLNKLPEHHSLTKILNLAMEKEVEQLPANSYVALMTMGHSKDVPILALALKRNFPYLGVIGSKSKRNIMEKELKNDFNVSKDLLCEFICPIGEDIGTSDPAEIAISITAQLLRYRDKLNTN